ncbi:hypothetical protein B0H16DRAFT_1574575 [Mycena metata]|uniref:Uncharacterized protein n=1 Tax=Mycena metata TaxID=1033252 RepID=A0AAD7I6F4_9AGAR|nr:hypothetical protein B0H16DRAFT_1574575 [Mycena metata]
MFRIFALLPILAVAAHAGNPVNLARQTTADTCVAPCQTLSTALSSAANGGLAAICNNDILNDYGSCYGCQVKSGELPQLGGQQILDAYTTGCTNSGHSVGSLTVAADGSTTGGSSGGASNASPSAGGNTAKTGGALKTSASTLVAASALVFVSFSMVL